MIGLGAALVVFLFGRYPLGPLEKGRDGHAMPPVWWALTEQRRQALQGGLLPDRQGGRLLLPGLGAVALRPDPRAIIGDDGAVYRLEQPVARLEGGWRLSETDRRALLIPLVEMEDARGEPSGSGIRRRILIDAGHGGIDSGAFRDGVLEKDLTLDLALWTGFWLEEIGFEVLLTRRDDCFLTLSERASMTDEPGVDLMVSLHCNAAAAPEARGLEILLRPAGHSLRLPPEAAGREIVAAWELMRRLGGDVAIPRRAIKRQNVQILRDSRTAAVLVEYGFLSNLEDRRLLTDPLYRMRAGCSTALAIRDWSARVF